ncbi:MAG: DUF5710 domain-containing protein [Turicibacter sp.]
MQVRLKVPEKDVDKAKQMGVQWDKKGKFFYVFNPDDLSKYSEWMDAEVATFFKNNPEFIGKRHV